MFNFLKGKIIEFSDSSVTVDTGAIGYRVFCPNSTIEKFQNSVQTEVLVYTELIVREDGWFLYGFSSTEEREWFKLLLTVQGVGAKVGLSILSCLSPADLWQAICYGDKDKLCLADGVGNKLALRIINELKDKNLPANYNDNGGRPILAGEEQMKQSGHDVTLNVISALVNLGYKRVDVLNAIKDTPPDQGFEETLRLVLNKLKSV